MQAVNHAIPTLEQKTNKPLYLSQVDTYKKPPYQWMWRFFSLLNNVEIEVLTLNEYFTERATLPLFYSHPQRLAARSFY